MAVLNEAVWRNSTTEFWVGFKLWGAIPLTFLFAAANVPMLMRHGLTRRGRGGAGAGAGRMSDDAILSIRGLRKSYASGTEALKSVDLDIRRGEIFALLGPNGAGKTTLINIVCGIVTPSGGTVLVDGKDHLTDYRHARTRIGLVPQELTTDAFESVLSTVSFSRGLFGKPRDPAKIEDLLKRLSLWDKRKAKMMELSGGMKRRVMIAKALSHEPDILFLDEPSAGVDVELRRDMWEMVRKLRADGTTIILTTHYIEEAEEMADRVGVISKGELIAAEDKKALMRKLGRKTLKLTLSRADDRDPARAWRMGSGARG